METAELMSAGARIAPCALKDQNGVVQPRKPGLRAQRLRSCLVGPEAPVLDDPLHLVPRAHVDVPLACLVAPGEDQASTRVPHQIADEGRLHLWRNVLRHLERDDPVPAVAQVLLAAEVELIAPPC